MSSDSNKAKYTPTSLLEDHFIPVSAKKPYDFLVFIGRFQPFHNGHKKVIDRALELAEHVVILVGSSYEARSYRNPFSFDERKEMILSTYRQEATTFHRDFHRIIIHPIQDHLYNDTQWIEEIQTGVYDNIKSVEIVKDICSDKPEDIREPKVGLIGHSKDHSSYYLSLFPQWDSENVPGYDEKRLLDATWIRELYFTERDDSQLMDLVLPAVVPSGTMDFLKKFKAGTHALTVGNEYWWLVNEHEYIEGYKKPYANLPHPVIFSTVDAVVVQSGHILLIKRKAAPGKGLLALPGGFIKPKETLQKAAIRELVEETRLKVPERTLRGSIKKVEIFDDPNRSSRGRVITNAFLIPLEARPKLPKVRGSSDAEYAGWFPLSELHAGMLFEDHYHIIRKMTAGL